MLLGGIDDEPGLWKSTALRDAISSGTSAWADTLARNGHILKYHAQLGSPPWYVAKCLGKDSMKRLQTLNFKIAKS